jgi:eukaryotic-like serine/threonine-protein kinase
VYRSGRFVLGKYELVRPLAEGGMASVWLARHSSLEVDVAVKLTPASEFDAHRQQRAYTEARLAAQLVHPGVCRVLDFGLTAEGDPCVVTELLQGETLEARLTLGGPFTPVEAVRIVLPLLDALATAHARGIVHQDVKPENVFLARDDHGRVQPKLLDFGIAREHERPGTWQRAGSISGTPAYMSPEQAEGRDDVDLRADLWSVCATLYELIAGQPPFDGETCEAVLAQVLDSQPRTLAEQALAERALSEIVQRGLEKDRERRWSSAAELSAALADWLLAQGIETDVTDQALRPRLERSQIRDTLESEAPFLLRPRRRGKARRLMLVAAVLALLSTSASVLRDRSRWAPLVEAGWQRTAAVMPALAARLRD